MLNKRERERNLDKVQDEDWRTGRLIHSWGFGVRDEGDSEKVASSGRWGGECGPTSNS